MNTDNLGNSLVFLSGMVNKLRLHDGVVFKVGGLITAFVEGVSLRSKTSHTVGLSKNNLTLNTLNVSSVT